MTNYFKLFSIPTSFTVDESALESAYKAAQRQYHPDKAGLEGVQKSIEINEAYHTLKHPLKRAVHLLSLEGITVLDEANTAKPNMNTLQEVMELQEAKAEAETPEQREAFKKRLQGLINTCEATLAEAFKKHDVEAAKNSTIRLSYLYKLA